MALDDAIKEVSSKATSRRTIVKTGAKLGYAAPLVAASFKLQSMSASAGVRVSNECKCGADCGDPNCDCFCLTTIENVKFCSNNFTCGTTKRCWKNSDCPKGWICQGGKCPGNCGQVCVPPCGTVVKHDGIGAADEGGTNRG